MSNRNGLKKVAAGMAIAGALTLTSAFSGVVFAAEDINIGVGELQECTISKSMDASVDGGDFLVWQDSYGATDSSQVTSTDVEWKYVSVRRF